MSDKAAEYRRDIAYWLAEVQIGGPIETIFDVGAHVGETAAAFAAACPNASIHAFEPDSKNYAELARNMSDFPSITPHHLAIGNRSGVADLRCNSGAQTSSLLANDDRYAEYVQQDWMVLDRIEPVEIDTLFGVCGRLGVDRIDLLKTDTQGLELEVLLGSGDMLTPSAIRSIAVEINFVPMYSGQASAAAILDTLLMAGYGIHGWVNIAHAKDGTWKWADLLCVGIT